MSRGAARLVALGLLAAASPSLAAPGTSAKPCWADGRSSDKAEIAGVLARYAHYADTKDDAGFAGLFTPDGTWEAEGLGRFAGTEALRNFIRGIPAGSRHITANYAIDVAADGTATARSYVMLLGMEAGHPVIRGTGIYDDVLVRIGCAWKFKSRKYVAWKGPPPPP
jgi:hypothetical protein